MREGLLQMKIGQTIDEIAFQTNLLALNAVLAAEAAQNTATLIEASVRQIKEGAELVDVTKKAFDGVAVQVEKVTHPVGEIAAAATEQARGIDQVNTAVGEMDRVAQQNAASAQGSASASEEMDTQAEQMKGMVKDRWLTSRGGTASSIPRDTLMESRRGSGKALARQAQKKQGARTRRKNLLVVPPPETIDGFQRLWAIRSQLKTGVELQGSLSVLRSWENDCYLTAIR